MVVQEWAKLRWGVFEEHGYPGDQTFPLFFYKVFSLGNKTLELSDCVVSPQTIHTASGERQVLTRNFCTNSPLVGREADARTGGPCAYDEATSLPEEHCMFYADQATAATASYMALPYLDSVKNFCDITEDITDVNEPSQVSQFLKNAPTRVLRTLVCRDHNISYGWFSQQR